MFVLRFMVYLVVYGVNEINGNVDDYGLFFWNGIYVCYLSLKLFFSKFVYS